MQLYCYRERERDRDRESKHEREREHMKKGGLEEKGAVSTVRMILRAVEREKRKQASKALCIPVALVLHSEKERGQSETRCQSSFTKKQRCQYLQTGRDQNERRKKRKKVRQSDI